MSKSKKDAAFYSIKLTPNDLKEILRERTGMDLDPDRYWFRVTHELTREHAPYSLITIEAIKRGTKTDN